HLHSLRAAQDRRGDGPTRRRLLNQPRELPRAAHALAVEIDDHVGRFQPGLLGGAVGPDLVYRDPLAGVADEHADVAAAAGEDREVPHPPLLAGNGRGDDERQRRGAGEGDEHAEQFEERHTADQTRIAREKLARIGPMAKTQPKETKAQILERAEREKVKFMRLQFTDILGTIKNVEIPDRQFDEALDGQIMFDGSSIEGFVRIEESDMYLKPDLSTFCVFPWAGPGGESVARMICDIYAPDGEPFVGCPRMALKKVIALAAARGYQMKAGPEVEFFLFQTRNGEPTTESHDAASYFDLSPVDQGEDVRREIVLALEAMGFHVEAAHHEVAPGQHEIDFRYDDVLTTADNVSTFRFIVKNVAIKNGLHATFMPKPIYGINGSGMHTHMSLFAGGT